MASSELLLWLPWLTTFSVLLAIICFLDLALHARRNLPPGPRPLPLIGSLHLLGSHPHRSLARLARTHGPLMSLRLGAVTTVVASSPEAARELLHKHDAAFASRSAPDALFHHAKNSVAWLPASSPRWRALRKVMRAELFAPHRLDALRHLRREKVQELADHVASRAAAGEGAVRVGLVAFTTMLNLLSRTIFSRDLAGPGEDDGRGQESSREFHRVVLEIFEAAGVPNVSDYFPALAAADLQGVRRRMDKLLARLHQVFDREVELRLSERSVGAGVCELPKNDFLDLLLNAAAVDDDGAGVLERDTLRSMFSDLFAAGTDTSSNTVEWAMAELLRNPISMAKARDELRQVTGGMRRNVEESEIHQLPYLQAVIKETFRLHPPVPLLLPRHAEKTTEVMGYTVPKGARVLVNVWAIGRDASVWSDPEKFVPERFLASAVDFTGGDFELVPFGAGRRVCPGMPLAVRMVHLVLGSLLNQFEWRLPEEEKERNGVDMSENFGLTLVKAVPLRAIPTHV